jgi:CheY-like chemotaxis protein/DNA invertase Pin-like site-specific DNA recombinase
MGDSERRQLEAAREFAKRNGLELDESLTPDCGLSGYHGTNRRQGTLGTFLEQVKAGEVAKGSVLLVENIDRLTRESVVDALETIIFGIIKHGIAIETICPPGRYDRASLNDGRIWELIAHVNRAHAESARKADLASANWRRKQRLATEEGRVLTAMAPAWLRVVNGKFEIIPEAAECIRSIFAWKSEGLGHGTIEAKLNREGRWRPPLKMGGGRPRKDGRPSHARQQTQGWRVSYLRKILSNPAVVGIYQPFKSSKDENGRRVRLPAGDPVENYFPPVVSPALFHTVQEDARANRNKGGRVAKCANLLAHLAKCAYCGGPMAYADKGGQRGGQWLVCDNGRRGVGCSRVAVGYNEVEDLVLSNCPKLQPSQVLPDPDEQAAYCRTLRQRVEGKRSEILAAETKINNLVDQIAETADKSVRSRYEAKVRELEAQKATLGIALAEGLVGVPLRILAAEDNDFNRDLLEHVLARLGLSAAMAVNGREALALLERGPFDLLLLDVHMPELDGFQVVGAIRERERTSGGHLPVIALTARSRKEDRERCLRAGMDECLTKPYSAADLWAAMDRVLRRDEKSAAVFDSSPIPHPSSLSAGLLDAPVLLTTCGGDPTMLRKMCRSLQFRVPEYLAAIRDALHAQDALPLREAAHKFCGMLSAFSTVASDQAASLEDLATRGLLNEALPIVEQLDKSATELARLAGGLTIETLRKQAEPADDPNRTTSRLDPNRN